MGRAPGFKVQLSIAIIGLRVFRPVFDTLSGRVDKDVLVGEPRTAS